MKTLLFCLLGLTGLYASPLEEGKTLFDEAECMKCHNTGDFTEKERKVSDYKHLIQRVDRCNYATDAGWFDDEVVYVADYLNSTYYLYKKSRLP